MEGKCEVLENLLATSQAQSPKPNIFRSAAARRLFWPSAAAANRLTPKIFPRRLGGGAAAFIGGQPKTRYIFEFYEKILGKIKFKRKSEQLFGII
jgi:hypothetical protein